jgi:hypothetical protein
LFLNNYANNIVIQYNTFYGTGSTAIAIVGDPNFDSSTPWVIKDYPQNINVYGNVAANVGMFVKQSAGVFVSISQAVVIERNVVFNSPRGGLVINDGFGGSHVWRRNVVFQTVLETSDHGPVDTWDRQQYEEGVRGACIAEENLLLGTVNGPKGIDFDDGTFNWISQNNVIVWGYQKFKGSFISSVNNIILYPLQGACAYITPQTRLPASFKFQNNTCVTNLVPYAYNGARKQLKDLCSLPNFDASMNTYYYSGTLTSFYACGLKSPLPWLTWKTKYLQDYSTVLSRVLPSVDMMMPWVTNTLDWVIKFN